jgi:UDP:flavonoid glycosyltransferase YjiC (YdhE family)
MRVLFTVSNWPGHYASLIPMGWALQAGGHEVRVLCAESEVGNLNRAGLSPVPLLSGWELDFQARLQNFLNVRTGVWPYPFLPLHPVTGVPLAEVGDFDLGAFMAAERAASVEVARHSTDAAVEYAREWDPDLVVHDPVSFEGRLVAAVLGIPAVLALWGPVGTHEDEPGLKLTPVDFSKAFERYGLPELSQDDITHVLDPCPDRLAPPTTAQRIPVRYVPYNGPGHLPPRWATARDADRPLVCVVWGNSATRIFPPGCFIMPRVLEALAAVDADVLVTANEADVRALGAVPDNVRVGTDIPLHLVLPGCSAVVHYGGAGCAMTAVAAGVPQLILPQGFDQPMIARRLAATGAARMIANHDATVEGIQEAVTALLTESRHAQAARRLGAEATDRPTPADVVAVLESLAARQPQRSTR